MGETAYRKETLMPYWITILLLVGLDQWSKLWTVAQFAPPADGSICTADPAVTLIPSLVELTRLHNYGAAWGSLAGMRLILIAVSLAVLAAVALLWKKHRVRHPLGLWAMSLLFAGGLGNLIDRVRLGYVVDMFHLIFWQSYPVFNVADICVVLGAILGAIYYLCLYDKYDAPNQGERT